MPPAVEPAMPPMTIVIKSVVWANIGQTLKSVVLNPAVDINVATWKSECLKKTIPTEAATIIAYVLSSSLRKTLLICPIRIK